jgi:hypothetical protein
LIFYKKNRSICCFGVFPRGLEGFLCFRTPPFGIATPRVRPGVGERVDEVRVGLPVEAVDVDRELEAEEGGEESGDEVPIG